MKRVDDRGVRKSMEVVNIRNRKYTKTEKQNKVKTKRS